MFSSKPDTATFPHGEVWRLMVKYRHMLIMAPFRVERKRAGITEGSGTCRRVLPGPAMWSLDLEEALKREIFEGTAGSWPVSEPAGQPSPAQLSSARM